LAFLLRRKKIHDLLEKDENAAVLERSSKMMMAAMRGW
jgi:hypothetical protein